MAISYLSSSWSLKKASLDAVPAFLNLVLPPFHLVISFHGNHLVALQESSFDSKNLNTLSQMAWLIREKASSTFSPVFAEVSRKGIPWQSAKACKFFFLFVRHIRFGFPLIQAIMQIIFHKISQSPVPSPWAPPFQSQQDLSCSQPSKMLLGGALCASQPPSATPVCAYSSEHI